MLNDEQKQAVKMCEGNVLIVAGPGTGKTRALTHKIATVMRDLQIAPARILAVTFTVKAARLMKVRLCNLLGDGAELPFVGTFHAYCYQLLQEHLNHDLASSIVTAKEQEALLESIPRAKRRAIRKIITLAKNLQQPFEAFTSDAEILRAIKDYQRQLHEKKLLEFDDLIPLTLKLFDERPELANTLSGSLKYLFIDEYQDINEVQYRLIRRIVSPQTKICAIGDPDQAIYAFRGSNHLHFLRFEEDFPHTNTIKLEKNYRSAQKIVRAANDLIRKNIGRIDKNLVSQQEMIGEIYWRSHETPWKEAGGIVEEIKKLAGGLDMVETDRHDGEVFTWHLSDIAVLYRTGRQGKLIEESFKKAGVPYQRVSGVPWYQTEEVQSVLELMKTTLGGSMGPELETLRTSQCLGRLIGVRGFEQTLRDSPEKQERKWKNLQQLLASALEFDHLRGRNGLEAMLAHFALLDEQGAYAEDLEAVTLMTIHAAKGLEFPVVFIAGLEEGTLPYQKEGEAVNLEEERRLFYVALTRAKERLYLSAGSDKPSPFIGEISPHFDERKTRPVSARKFYRKKQMALW